MRKAVVYSLTAILVLSCFFLPSMSERSAVLAQESAPEIKRVRPNVITAGTRTFTIRLEGRRFAAGANVLFDGVALASPRVTAKKGRVLLAEVDASLVASPGDHTIQALNPDGATSASSTFTVQPKDPNLSIFLRENAAQEDAGLIFLPTIITDSFGKGSDILVWGRSVEVEEVSRGVVIQISDQLANDPAEIPVTLRDKDGNLSNTEIFFIVPIPAEISFVDPESLEVGTDDVELHVHGVFKPDAVVVVNDTELPTTVGKNGRLEAIIPGSLRSQPTRLVVRVEQDGIQSQDAILPVTPTEGPFIFTIAPVRIRHGERKPSIDVVGANFRDTTAFIDGQETNIRASTRRRLTIAVPPDIALGTHEVRVMDPDGNVANVVSFEVVPDVEVTTLTGNGRFGFNEGCVSADEARFVRPRRMAFGPDGLLYITDQQNHAIRTVDVDTGETCTVVGTGEEGYHDSGNALGKPPTLSFPSGVAVNASGTIYITENGNNVVRRVQRSGGSITVDTFAGSFNEILSEDKQNKFNSTRQGLASC